MYERDPDGVKIRNDGKGDAWAKAHRGLGPTFNMQDIDALFGWLAFGQNTGEKLFLEYVPDDWENRENKIRDFRAVAMFDRKASKEAAFASGNRVSTSFYLWIARTLSATQKYPVRFFYVIGAQHPPWLMIEIDITTGNEIGDEQIISGISGTEWRALWTRLGLSEHRERLRSMIQTR